jgi:hypothetical protein
MCCSGSAALKQKRLLVNRCHAPSTLTLQLATLNAWKVQALVDSQISSRHVWFIAARPCTPPLALTTLLRSRCCRLLLLPSICCLLDSTIQLLLLLQHLLLLFVMHLAGSHFRVAGFLLLLRRMLQLLLHHGVITCCIVHGLQPAMLVLPGCPALTAVAVSRRTAAVGIP